MRWYFVIISTILLLQLPFGVLSDNDEGDPITSTTEDSATSVTPTPEAAKDGCNALECPYGDVLEAVKADDAGSCNVITGDVTLDCKKTKSVFEMNQKLSGSLTLTNCASKPRLEDASKTMQEKVKALTGSDCSDVEGSGCFQKKATPPKISEKTNKAPKEEKSMELYDTLIALGSIVMLVTAAGMGWGSVIVRWHIQAKKEEEKEEEKKKRGPSRDDDPSIISIMMDVEDRSKSAKKSSTGNTKEKGKKGKKKGNKKDGEKKKSEAPASGAAPDPAGPAAPVPAPAAAAPAAAAPAAAAPAAAAPAAVVPNGL